VQQQEAYDINVVGNRNLVRNLPAQAQLVYISTYYVFDGSKAGGKKAEYTELDVLHPLNYYGKTKLWAEQECAERANHSSNSLIIRTSKIFGLRDSRNFIARLTENLRHNQTIFQAEDQYTNPILVEDLARIIKDLIHTKATGIYHVGGLEKVSNYQFAAAWAAFLRYDQKLIKAMPSELLNQPAARPKDCSLNIQKLLHAGLRPISLAESFEKLKSQLDENQFNKI
jgi:dTDP-4-dehydrorhamnose reductase